MGKSVDPDLGNGLMRKVLLGISTVVLLGAVGVAVWFSTRDDGLSPIVPAQLETLDPEIRAAVHERLAAINEQPDDSSARAALALLYHANSMFGPAAEMYEQAVDLNPDDAPSWYRLGLARYELGDVDGAFDACRTALEFEPEYAPARRRLGHWLLEQSRFDAAQQQFAAARELEPENPLNDIGLASVQLRREQYEPAFRTLNAVVQNHPRLRYAYRLMGEALHGMGSDADARRCIAHAAGATLPTDDPWAQPLYTQRLGYAGRLKEANRMLAVGDVDDALKTLEQLRQQHPNDPTILNNVASAYGQRGDYQRMIEILEQSVQQDPDRFSTHLNLSIAYENARNLSQALAHAQRAVELNPNVGQTHFQLGRLYLISRQYDRAEQALASAIHHGQATIDARRMLGQAQIVQGRLEEARRTFQTFTRLYPGNVDGHLLLAEVCGRLGRFDEAQRAVNAARSLDSSDQRIAGLQRAITEAQAAAQNQATNPDQALQAGGAQP